MKHLVLVVLSSLFILQTAAVGQNGDERNRSPWSVELSGGIQFFNPDGLGLATESENSYLDLYFRERPGNQTISDPGLSDFTNQLLGRTRIKYRIGRYFRLALGMGLFHGTQRNNRRFSFERDEGWRVLTDTLDYQALDTRLSMLYPHLGLFTHFPLGPWANIELGFSAGPLFAKAVLDREITDTIEGRESNPVMEYLMYRDVRSLTMEGRGSGFGASVELKIAWRLNRMMDLFFETGYSINHLNALKGKSTMTAGGVTREWEGTWFLVEERADKPWASATFSYPSNDPQLQRFRSGPFHLDLHGFLTLQMGVSLHLQRSR